MAPNRSPKANNILAFGECAKLPGRPAGPASLLHFEYSDKQAKNFNLLVVTVYESSQKMLFLKGNNCFEGIPNDFTCNIIHDFACDRRRPQFLLKIA